MSGDPGWVKQATGPGNPPETFGATADTTDGTLLGGRIDYRQYRAGYRTGLEPVLMAAAVPARAGQRVLEAGCGAGAGLLCLAARVAGVSGVGIEQDAAMAAMAVSNLRRNGLDWPVLEAPLERADRLVEPGTFHHALANPPWHRARATRSPDARRDLARRAPDGILDAWTGALASLLRRRGSLTLALPAALHADAAAAMLRAGFGAVSVLPFWPRPDRAARIILVQGVLGSGGDGAVLPGLVLHRADGSFSDEADAVLRSGNALSMVRRGRSSPPERDGSDVGP